MLLIRNNLLSTKVKKQTLELIEMWNILKELNLAQ